VILLAASRRDFQIGRTMAIVQQVQRPSAEPQLIRLTALAPIHEWKTRVTLGGLP
jgi:hypothetical protein